jgi:hypothetical protein
VRYLASAPIMSLATALMLPIVTIGRAGALLRSESGACSTPLLAHLLLAHLRRRTISGIPSAPRSDV